MPLQYEDLDPAIVALAKGDWGLQDPIQPLPGYFPDVPNEWLDRHEQFCEIARKGGVNVLFFGDSITQGWGAADQEELWNQYYAPLGAANFAIGGDRTQQLLWRMEHGTLEGINPKLVVLMIGVNNLWNDQFGSARVAEGIAKVVSELQQRLPGVKILLQGILPTGEFAENPLRAKITEINAISATLDNGSTLRFIDFGHIFLEEDGRILASTMPDFCHLSTGSYAKWQLAIKDLLSEMLA